MGLEVMANQASQLGAFLFQLFEGARPFLGRVRRHLAAVDGEEFVTQQALVVAHQQHLLEQLFDFIRVTADELGQGGEMWNRIAGQGLEDDVGLAAPLHLAAGGDALGISEQDDLQENGRIVGQPTGVFIAVLGMKHRQVQLVLDQVVHRVFKGAGLELFLVIDDDHGILVVVVMLEAGHLTTPCPFA